MILDGRRVLVTGAGRDTGRLLAIAFGARGADVVVTARRRDAAEETAEQVRSAGGVATAVELDLTDASSIEALQLDRLDILVNNGARYLEGPAGSADIADTIATGGIRVISLFPSDFDQHGPRTTGSPLTAQSVVDCVLFAVTQPRDCFLRALHFEQL